MSNYTFTFKKGDITVEFFTTDKQVVERQFNAWVIDASTYARDKVNKIMKERVPEFAQIQQESQISKPKVQDDTINSVSPAPPTAQTSSEIVDKAASMLKSINSINNPEQNLQNTVPEKNFEEILDAKVENPEFEPQKRLDLSFVDFVTAKNTSDKFHYLIITAYYLSEIEKMERFSLKQINAKLMHNFAEIIDHATLQSAISQGLIDLVPDLTGISEVSEYKLTASGENFYNTQI